MTFTYGEDGINLLDIKPEYEYFKYIIVYYMIIVSGFFTIFPFVIIVWRLCSNGTS